MLLTDIDRPTKTASAVSNLKIRCTEHGGTLCLSNRVINAVAAALSGAARVRIRHLPPVGTVIDVARRISALAGPAFGAERSSGSVRRERRRCDRLGNR